MRILLTGGTGFIGKHYVSELKNKIDEIFILSRKRTYEDSKNNIVYINGDYIKDNFGVIEDIDWIIHLGAKTGIQESYYNSNPYIRNNIEGTINMLEKARRKNSKFLFISTQGVYGSKGFKFEDNYLNPETPYDISKASAELMVQFYGNNYDIDYRIIRLGNIFGPRERKDDLIPNIIQKALNGENIKLYKPDLSQGFLYVKDAVKGIELVRKKGEEKSIYNLTNNISLKISQLTRMILKRMNKDNLFKGFKNEERDKDTKMYRMSINKIKDLGWKKDYTMKKGIDETIEYFKKEKK